MKKILLLVAAMCVAAIAWTGIAWGAGSVFAKKRVATNEMGDVRSVVVDVDHGDVSLQRGGRGVSVREVSHWSFLKPHVDRSVRNGMLTVHAHCDGGFFLGRCSTDLRVAVPDGVPVKVRVHVGNVSGDALRTGAIDAAANVGDVHLGLAQRTGVRATANVGDVRVDVPRGTYAVDADADVGDTGVHGLVTDERAPLRIHATANVGDVRVQGH